MADSKNSPSSPSSVARAGTTSSWSAKSNAATQTQVVTPAKTTNPWDNIVVRDGDPATDQGAAESRSGTIFSGSEPAEGRPNPNLAARLNQAYAAPPSARPQQSRISEERIKKFAVPRELSAADSRNVLAASRSVLNARGEIIPDQIIYVQFDGEPTPRKLRTSSRSDTNDPNTLTQADLAILVSSAAERLAQSTDPGELRGYRQEDGISDLLGGADTTEAAFGTEKAQYELLKLLDTAEAVAERNSKPLEQEVSAPTTEQESIAAEENKAADDSSIDNWEAAGADSDSASDGGGADAVADLDEVDETTEDQPENPTEEIAPEPKLAEKPQPEDTIAADNPPQQSQVQTEPAPDVLELTIEPPLAATAAAVSPSSVPTATAVQSQTTTSPTSLAPPHEQQHSNPSVDDPQLVALLTEKFSLDYAGRFVPGENIPPELKNELTSLITAHLSEHYSSFELEKLRYSPYLYKKAVEKLHTDLKTSSVKQSVRALLETTAQSNIPESQRQRILAALQADNTLILSQYDNPYQNFVAEAGNIVAAADSGALFSANISAAKSSLEASIIAIGEEKTQRLLQNASPEQLRSMLNIPPFVTLSDDQLESLRFSVVALTPQLTAQLVFESQSNQVRGGLFTSRAGAPPSGGQRAPQLQSIPGTQPDDSEEAESTKEVAKLGKHAAKALTQTTRGTKAKLDRIQLMLQGSWDSLPREVQEFIYEENGIAIPSGTHKEAQLPYTTAFIAYDQNAITRLLDKRGVQETGLRNRVTEATLQAQDFLQSQRNEIEAATIGTDLRRNYAAQFPDDTRVAILAHGQGLLAPDGSFVENPTTFYSPEDMALFSGGLTPDNDLLSYAQMAGAAEDLSYRPDLFQNYQAAYGNFAGSPRTFINRLSSRFSNRSLSRADALRARVQSLRQTADRVKDLQKLGVSLAGSLAGNPVAMAKLATALFTTKTGRQILAIGTGAALLPLLPPLLLALNAANWWNSATTALGNVWSGITGGGSAGGSIASGGGVGGTGDFGASAANPASAFTSPTSASSLPVSGQAGTGGVIQTSATISGTTTSTVSTGLLGTFAGVAFSSSFGFVVFTVFMVFIVIQGAFLIPTPSLLPTQSPYETISQSKYAVLSKKAAPKKAANNAATDIVYTIEFSPKSDYKLEITDVADIYGFLGEGDSSKIDGTDPAYPKIISPLTKEVFGSGTIESQITRRYTQQLEAVDTLVLNTITITFNVLDENGTVIATGEKMSNTAGVRIGNPKTGCWPTSGEITQGPRSGRSHQVLEAFDIGAPTGTPIYAPFSGQACNNVYRFDPDDGYGHHVVITFDYNGLTLKAVFSHMHTKTDLGATGCREVTEGEKIGIVGSTGNSTGPHLHYEILRAGLPAGMGIRDFLADGPTAQVGNKVQSCYD